PNIQINGQRSDTTIGVPVNERLKLSFHTKSLPTSRLIWHCPHIVLFSSQDKKVGGPDYTEYALIRLDGESSGMDQAADNRIIVNKTEAFESWDSWKKQNKEGFDCEVSFERTGNTVITMTENNGIYIRNQTKIKDDRGTLYAALTGDQCVLTNIKING
ncbi:MAG: diguanylate cyclase, partial [Lachnospiraceae bacterium]|nr:diguanylate cyclase [Lachnospiraceae bacterium]